MSCWEVLEELQPHLGNVPRKERWQEIAKRMEADGKSLHEVTYTWNEGELSLEVGLGAGEQTTGPWYKPHPSGEERGAVSLCRLLSPGL